MLLVTYKRLFIERLSTLYDEQEAQQFFHLLLEEIHQMKRLDLALQPDTEVTDEQLLLWNHFLNELLTQKPIQYILGKTSFFGLPFYVNENVLIPRPETEELVQLLLKECERRHWTSPNILDIGTGSGCIPISLGKHLPNATITAMDVSEKALEMAHRNAELNAVDVRFERKDILVTNHLIEQYDVIVSNPPYVRHLEKDEIKSNVLDYEPHLALFVEDNDALLFYRKIAQLAKQSLTKGGLLFFEINQYLGKETVEVLKLTGFDDVTLYQDIFGNDRMLKAVQ